MKEYQFPDGAEVTNLMRQWQESGDVVARNTILSLVYEFMVGYGAKLSAKGRATGTSVKFGTTHDIAHSAVRVFMQRTGVDIRSRAHLLGHVSMTMRNLHLDRLKHHSRSKRGGDSRRVELADDLAVQWASQEASTEVALMLERLEKADPRGAAVVTMRFYGGMTFKEMGEVFDVEYRTAKRWFLAARRLLADWLGESGTREATGVG